MTSAAIDTPPELRQLLGELYERFARLDAGEVATYIPALVDVDPETFAIAVCTTEGDLISAGDAEHRFTLQSICKPFLYSAALTRLGRAVVHRRVGVEPSGDAFNSIVRLESGTNRPHNPMINAGAIAVASLLREEHPRTALGEMVAVLARYAGRDTIEIDDAMYRSEKSSGDRNRAIAHLMRHLGMIAGPVEETVDLYFTLCAAEVTVRDLAVMGATLAHAGINPVTGARVVSRSVVRDVLALMSTCGMYDGTGRFAVEVGVPAKSGVSGGILAVAPGRLGLGVVSPRLDARGNSARGMAVLEETARRRSLHLFDPTAPTRAPERAPDAAAIRSAFAEAESASASAHGGAVASYIPELAAADPGLFGLAACTVDGTEVSLGDADRGFTVQAAANPFAYALALVRHGAAAVHERVGVEPSGNPYDAIVFDPETNRPYNPLSNAGAIALAAMRPGNGAARRFRRLAEDLGRFAGGGALPVDEGVYRSEVEHGARNRAIGYMLRNVGIIDDVDATLDLYFRQCALVVTCQDLARMGATLAAGGRNPITDERAADPGVVQRVLTVMYTCGMHDASGQFAFEVGLPGKSGISGAIVAVVPGRMGLAVYSPPVDQRGASVRGFAALCSVSGALHLGVFATSGNG